MLYRETKDGFIPWFGEPINGVSYSRNIGSIWSAEELAKIGLYLPVVPEAPPGKRSIGDVVKRVDGVVQYVCTYVDIIPDVPEFITRRQCALQLLAINQITAQEALYMTRTAAVPAAISAIFDSLVGSGAWTPEQRILAEIDFAAANYYRSNSLLSLMGFTEQEIDQFFISAANL